MRWQNQAILLVKISVQECCFSINQCQDNKYKHILVVLSLWMGQRGSKRQRVAAEEPTTEATWWLQVKDENFSALSHTCHYGNVTREMPRSLVYLK
jgi:hypothetical protein